MNTDSRLHQILTGEWQGRNASADPGPYGGKSLTVVIALFIGIVLLMLFMATASLHLMSSVRAYVAGEGLWSKGQKDAVYFLQRYASSRDEHDYAAFLGAIAVPLGDRQARMELENAHPDLRIVRAGFLAGRNSAEDIDGMILLYRWFRKLSFLKQAIAIWTDADRHILQLERAGVALHDEVAKARPDSHKVGDLLAEITTINVALTPQAELFSQTLGRASRFAYNLFQALLTTAAFVLLGIGVLITRRTFRQRGALIERVRDSESRQREILQNAPFPILLMQSDGRSILYANRLASEKLGLHGSALAAGNADKLYADIRDREVLLSRVQRDATVRDFEIQLRDATGKTFWALVSAHIVSFGGEACILAGLNDITERKHMQDHINHLAYYDELTALPNRAMFGERLDHALERSKRNGRQLAVLFMDLDRFKVINDTLGHESGDKVLRQLAGRFNGELRKSDTVARLGGDEFVVLIEDLPEKGYVDIVAEKLLGAAARPFDVNGQQFHLSGSIGVSIYPNDGEDAPALLRNADVAMYAAKRHGKNNFQYYSAKADVHSIEQLEIESALRPALDHHEFFLEFQPIVDAADSRVAGVEALLRWRHPQKGVIPPLKFIPLAEETGLIVPIGEWILHAACAQLREWSDPRVAHLRMAVNLSARQFNDSRLLHHVRRAIESAGIDPSRLEIELTESMVMGNAENAVRIFAELKAMGVRLSIDDFGTGYSSLAYLRRFPIDCIKIDRSFVQDIPHDKGNMEITRAVMAMAHNLNLKVTAEGVETQSQLDFLREYRCDRLQGYYFSRPVKQADFSALIREGNGRLPVKQVVAA
ncbi:MAG TPA: EAL domain-containing protein [Burkholderiales bacterium]|nr:EAL domain-containing protein [Burkholderiales bacterium]